MLFDSLDYRELPDGVSVKVRVQPRASRNAIVGISGDCLKVSLTSPPVDGEANAACIHFMADIFGIAKNRVSIFTGNKSRNKLIKLSGIDKEKFFAVLSIFLH